MDLLTFLGYYLVVDAILSLVVFVTLVLFRKKLLLQLRLRLRNWLGVDSLNSRIDDMEIGQLDDEIEKEEYEEEEPIKPEFEKNMRKSFNMD